MGDDVVLVLVAEVADGGQHGIGRGLAQPAERRLADHAAQFVEQRHLLARSAARGDRGQDAQRLVQPHAAGHALAARLGVRELDKVARHIDHAVVFVQHHHAARSHDGAKLRQALVIDRRIQHLDRNAAARGPAGLHGLDAPAVHRALAHVVDEVLQRRAQRHLHQAGVLDLAHQRKHFGSGAFHAAGLGKPRRTAADDGRDVVPGLDVVDVGRLAVQTLLRREGRAGMRPSRVAFERGNQRRLFAADKGSRALHQLDVEVEAAVQDIRAQQAILARLLDGPRQPAHRQRILGAHINNAVGRAHRIGADHHPLQQRMRIALDLVAVHIRAGVALIGVADDVFLVAPWPWPGNPIYCQSGSPRRRAPAALRP